jgi:two-component system, chemotaxis family, chemotaxis protein CheY
MKKQILAVDDDSSIRELLEFLLRNDYNVITKKDGMEAMMWLSEGNIPDLIITDVDMPRLNGYEFFKNVRRSGFYRDIPIIVLSGLENSKLIITCLQQGADDYILKPFNPESLYAKIERVLAETNISTDA